MDYSPSARTIRHVSVSEVNPKSPYQSNYSENGTGNNWKSTTYGALQYAPSAPTPFCNEDATFLCHGSHSEPSADSSTSLVGLLLALTVHSVLEGLAIGLQKATSEVGNSKYLTTSSSGNMNRVFDVSFQMNTNVR